MSEHSTTWIADTAEAVERAGDARQLQIEVETLVECQEALDAALPELSMLAAAADVEASAWWPAGIVPANLLRELRQAQTDLDGRQLRTVTGRLDRFRVQARTKLVEAWRDHVDQEVGRGDDLKELAAVLSTISGLGELSAELRQRLGQLERLRRNLPDATALNSLSTIAATLDGLEDRLPEAVREFVAAAARGGATLDDLGAGVRDWLIENDALGSFKIVVGRPAGAST